MSGLPARIGFVVVSAMGWGNADGKSLNPYTTRELLEWGPRLEERARDVWFRGVAPTFKDKSYASSKTLEFPLPSGYADPFLYVSNSAVQTVTIPILSLKFLHDLIYARTWLAVHGYCTDAVFQYINAVKYKPSSEFPGGKYPSPLIALGIAPPEQDSGPKRAAVQSQFDYHFRNTLLFILGHEIGHFVVGERIGSVEESERAADAFAMQIIGHTSGDFIGMTYFFTFHMFWGPTRSDYDSELAYSAALYREVHPPSSERIELAGLLLRDRTTKSFPDEAPAEMLEAAKAQGVELISLARLMNGVGRREGLRQVAKATKLSDLKRRTPQGNCSFP